MSKGWGSDGILEDFVPEERFEESKDEGNESFKKCRWGIKTQRIIWMKIQINDCDLQSWQRRSTF